jgi:hypothetical protein
MKCRDNPLMRSPKRTEYRFKDPSLSTRKMTEVINKDLNRKAGEGEQEQEIHLINPEREKKS